MYENFYKLKEKPFSVTPDSKYFYASEKHEEALSRLLYAIEDRRGFVVITGEIAVAFIGSERCGRSQYSDISIGIGVAQNVRADAAGFRHAAKAWLHSGVTQWRIHPSSTGHPHCRRGHQDRQQQNRGTPDQRGFGAQLYQHRRPFDPVERI